MPFLNCFGLFFLKSQMKPAFAKAAMAKASSFLQLFSGKLPIELIVVDLTREMLDDLHASLHIEDDEEEFTAKAATFVERYSFRRKDRYLEKVVECVKELGYSKRMPVLLYSIAEDKCDFVF
eukprot:m.29736 g.29736  ORF g.29736 m.29736 type:complete len:122 (+) comp31222_c0_seq1:30-395(+)